MNSKLKLIAFITLLSTISCKYIQNSDKPNSIEISEKIKIIPDNEIRSIDELVNYNYFKGKVLYLYYWEPRSMPCISEFKYYDELRKRYINKDLEFIFLTIKPNNVARNLEWKEIITKFNLEGYHISNNNLMYDFVKQRIRRNGTLPIDKILNVKVQNDTFPIIRLFDKNGVMKTDKAPKPSDKTKLYKEIEELL